MIDIQSEHLLSFTEAAKHLPNGKAGKPVHVATIHRWASRPTAQGAKLESLRIGGVRYTSIEALSRFIEACNQDDGTTPTTRTTAQRNRDHERAHRELMTAGIKT